MIATLAVPTTETSPPKMANDPQELRALMMAADVDVVDEADLATSIVIAVV